MTELSRGKWLIHDLHARYHDMPGNLYGKDDCPWERCEFWDAAKFTIDVLRSARLLLPEGAETGTAYGWISDPLTNEVTAHSLYHSARKFAHTTHQRSVFVGPWVPVEEDTDK